MSEARLPDILSQHIVRSGYYDASNFAYSFLDPESFESWLEQLFVTDDFANKLGMDPTRWATSPVAGQLRRLWNEAGQACGPSSVPAASASDWVDQPPAKLSDDKANEMRRVFEQCYRGIVLTDHCLPGRRYWSTVWDQVCSKSFKWIPWTQILSVAQEAKILEARGRRSHSALSDLGSLLRAATDEPSAVSEGTLRNDHTKVEQMFKVRRITFALCQACHLATLEVLDNKFLELYMADVQYDSGLRGPNLHELMKADKDVYSQMFRLVREESWALEQAVHEFSYNRADVVALLLPRPRPALPARVEYRNVDGGDKGAKGKGRDRGRPWSGPEKGKGDKGKGKGDRGKGDKGRAKRGKPDTSGKKRPFGALEGWEDSWHRDVLVNGVTKQFCMRWNVGSCNHAKCNFIHKCPVPKADGSPCNGAHRAVDHRNMAQPRT